MPCTDSIDINLIILLQRKENLQLMPNWRGICLMSLATKLYNHLVKNRIRSPIDAILRKNQAGFITSRSCIQQKHILRRIMDGAFSQNMDYGWRFLPLFITLVDFKKVFDSIDRDMMFVILQHYKIPDDKIFYRDRSEYSVKNSFFYFLH